RRAEVEATTASLHERVRQAEAQRDRALAERAGGGLSASGIAELRQAALRLQRVSAEVSALVDAPRASRTPLALPGSVTGDQRGATEFLLRSGAAVIVDGYNVAKLGWPALTLEDQRRRLSDLVDNVVRRFASPTTVVFDGADVVGAASERRRLARVTYSPAGVTADDVIVHEVEAMPTDRSVVVVTDDLDVRRRTRRLGANQLPSAALLDVGLR
ncbi:MAG: NYN domain-containing protein, partial [Actinomycetota bacterium]|nr:NYN domain-containing protein [Actinomycetota bacterium]